MAWRIKSNTFRNAQLQRPGLEKRGNCESEALRLMPIGESVEGSEVLHCESTPVSGVFAAESAGTLPCHATWLRNHHPPPGEWTQIPEIGAGWYPVARTYTISPHAPVSKHHKGSSLNLDEGNTVLLSHIP